MTDNPASPTRAFTSYSWTSPSHEKWVIQIASRLREDGVDVILDRWDLKPGHDANAFMESMVTDTTVTKVMMICDRAYVEKANKRAGGVGTESQIISPELYTGQIQDKFAAIVVEKDDNGKPCVPVFYKGRIFFDFTNHDRFEESYEELLRWLVDMPMHIKPTLGSIPVSALKAPPTTTLTQSRARRAEEALRQGSNTSIGLLRDYAEAFIVALKTLAPIQADAEPFDESVIKSVILMRPYGRQLLELVATLARFDSNSRTWDVILSLFERLARLTQKPSNLTSWHSHQFDSYKIFSHDIFIAAFAIIIDEGRYDLVKSTILHRYIIPDYENPWQDRAYTIMYQHAEVLDVRNQRMSLNRSSIFADLIKEEYQSESLPSFTSIMQADLILFLRSNSDGYGYWYPTTLVYSTPQTFEVFLRSESARFFDTLSASLGFETPDSFKYRIEQAAESDRTSRMFNYRGIGIKRLTNFENLASVR